MPTTQASLSVMWSPLNTYPKCFFRKCKAHISPPQRHIAVKKGKKPSPPPGVNTPCSSVCGSSEGPHGIFQPWVAVSVFLQTPLRSLNLLQSHDSASLSTLIFCSLQIAEEKKGEQNAYDCGVCGLLRTTSFWHCPWNPQRGK